MRTAVSEPVSPVLWGQCWDITLGSDGAEDERTLAPRGSEIRGLAMPQLLHRDVQMRTR